MIARRRSLLAVFVVSAVAVIFFILGSISAPIKIDSSEESMTITTTTTTIFQTVNTTSALPPKTTINRTETRTVTSTTTVFPPVNATITESNRTSLVFLGDNKLRIQSLSGRSTVYDYTRFPYSDFTFRNFTFTYREGTCEGASPDKIQLLPCGSQLSVTFPSGTSAVMLTESSSLTRQEHLRWTALGTAVINGELQNAGLLLVVLDDGSQTVYVYTRIGQ